MALSRSGILAVVALLATGAGGGQATSLVEPRFVCRGMEPFWRLEVDRARATLEMPEMPARRLEGTTASLDRLGVWAFRGRSGEAVRDLVTVIERRACTAPSGRRLEHRALVVMPDGDLVAGCCTAEPVASAAEAGEEGWARHLGDLLPAIDACLAAVDDPAEVLRAWPMNHGMVGVHLNDVLSRQWECVAPRTGGAVDRFGPAGGGRGRPPGGGQGPVFTRAAEPPPLAPCVERQEVMDAGGRSAGWLSYRVC